MEGQRNHIREVGNRLFGDIALPVGIRGERSRGVEGQMRRHHVCAKVLRVERQIALKTQQAITHQERNHAEHQHRSCVLRPLHVVVRIHPQKLVGESFDPTENRMQERALSSEHLRHEEADRLYRQQEDDKVNRYLKRAGGVHARTSPGAEGRKSDRLGQANR
jgi:ribosomal protein L16/L10AE